AVVGAADATILDEAIVEGGPAMRAMLAHQPVATLGIAEQHQIFTQQPHAFPRVVVVDVRYRTDRLPVPPQQLTPRGARPHPGHQLILFLGKHRGLLTTQSSRGVGERARYSPLPAR